MAVGPCTSALEEMRCRVCKDKEHRPTANRIFMGLNVLIKVIEFWIRSFIHSGHFYSAPSSPLLYSEALPTTARILYRSFTKRAGNCRYTGLAQGPYVAAGAGVESKTLRLN